MTETLNPKTLDLTAVLSGQSYPTSEVKVYFDDSLGFAIQSIREGLAVADRLGRSQEADELHAQLEDLVSQVKGAEYTVHLKSIPTHVRKSVLAKTREKFPDKTNMFGEIMDNFEQNQEYTKNLWLASITKIVDPSGAVAIMDENTVNNIIKFAPSSAQKAINDGIEDLATGALSGYEYAAQELDFLSTRSTTEDPEG